MKKTSIFYQLIPVVIGAILSGFSLYQHWLLKFSGGMARGFCDAKGVIGCDSVSVSPWAEPIFGLPIAAMALGLLLLIGVLDSIPRFRERTSSLYILLGIGSLFYLAIMLLVVRQICPLCLATHACIWLVITLKFFGKKVWHTFFHKDWMWLVGIIVPILFAAILTHFGLPILKEKMNWEPKHIGEGDFIQSSPPTLPVGAPIIIMGKSENKIPMIVATDFMCLHCRDHFFELSRALQASGKSAEITLLMDPLDTTCNPASETLHPGACHAARVGLCQAKNGKLEIFFRNIYLTPGRAMGGPETLLTTETNSPEERKQLEECVASREIEETLQKHLTIVMGKNIFGTPVTWVGGYQFMGAMAWQDWEEILRRIQ